MISIGLHEFLGGLAVFIGLVEYCIYLRSIMRGEAKPHAITWGIWGIMMAIVFFAQLLEGGGAGSWLTAVSALFTIAFFSFSLTASSRQYITRTDWWMLGGALLAVVPWILTDNPLWSVILITLMDACAYGPTVRKAFYHPHTEPAISFGLASLKWLPAIFALSTISLTTALYPVFLMLANGSMTIMLLMRRKQLRYG